jgi:hypothetical protein
MLRLAAARSSRAALPLRRVRGMCAVADPDKIVKDLDVAITDFTTKMENPPPPPDYTVAQIQADAETGSINVSKVGEIFGSHEPEQRKIMMTIASRINELARGIQDTKVESIDWDMWTERYTSIGMGEFIEKFKADALAAEAEQEAEIAAENEKLMAEWTSEITKVMEGPKGLKAAYTEMESRCKKIQADTISTLEEMKTDAMEIDTLTIASILEKNPEWKAAIEEDISNNIWDPSHIPDKIKDSIGPPADKEAIAA